jgi:hypothetical protein
MVDSVSSLVIAGINTDNGCKLLKVVTEKFLAFQEVSLFLSERFSNCATGNTSSCPY